MQIKAQAPQPPDMAGSPASPYLQAYFELMRLKYLFRQGWLRVGIPSEQAESVAEHTFGVAVLALWLAQAHFPQLDLARVLGMALLHDFGEIDTGDLTPADLVEASEKQARERASVRRVLAKLPDGSYYLGLWEEFEANQSAEARFVRQIDRLEMAFQASVYAQQGHLDLEQFFHSAAQALEDPLLINLGEVAHALSHSGPGLHTDSAG